MKILREIAAVIAGLLVGSMVNMGLIMISGKIFPLPAGVDNTTTEGLTAGMHLFEPQYFLFPFLAHALGTLVGAFLATKLSKSKTMVNAFTVGFLFLLGGISMVVQLPAPMWFNVTDLVLAYIPMAYLGFVMGKKR
ncbi:hypothetical protein H1R17_10340 [Flavobacterium sp. xlx-214]|uniref:hypothetical protein n=1 Tax=unclassified Flavobacterium TaxID=196869 RepID=UPI0013D10100|nr:MULTISPECIES: hypothetical protein [unclassified Flavobacterium]MBA5791613.1 hypothetical protein [Flavobacterium sp. xlx-221]QMI82859.1 hypothetical protein H1R17_10340 [Flavobacterium sp. xlx-214]